MLKDVLDQLNGDHTVFLYGKREVTSNQIKACFDQRKDLYKKFSGKKIAVLSSDNFSLAILLLYLDGCASQILIFPFDFSGELINSFLNKTATDFILTNKKNNNLSLDCKQYIFKASNTPVGLEIETELPGFSDLENKKYETRWILATSGTTGTPKLINHSLCSLTRTTKRNLLKGKNIKWGMLYGLTRFAGLQVFLQSILGGSTFIFVDVENSVDNILEKLALEGCTSLSATPTMWKKILMTDSYRSLKLRHITLGGEIVDKFVLSSLSASFPSTRIVHIYASTEAGVGFSVDDKKEGFPTQYLSEGYLHNALLKVKNGKLFIKPMKLNDSFKDKNSVLYDDDGYIDTGDLVKVTKDRCYFLGRENGSINVGGNKVQPEEIENVLLGYPGVVLASVEGKPSPITGSLVQATIVLRKPVEDIKKFKKDLKSYCREHLENYKVPAFIHIKDSLDVNTNGKVKRG